MIFPVYTLLPIMCTHVLQEQTLLLLVYYINLKSFSGLHELNVRMKKKLDELSGRRKVKKGIKV